MESDEIAPTEQLKDEVRVRRALAVIDHQVTHGGSIRDACEACNVPERSFFRWVNQGVLANHLAECRESRSKVASMMAAEALTDVMHYMIEIATGRKVVRGANPIAAARFVYSAAGLRDRTSPPKPSGKTNVLAFLPELVTFNVVQGTLAVDSEGRMEIIDGEVEDLDDESSRREWAELARSHLLGL